MSQHIPENTRQPEASSHATLRTYLRGFALSITLTLAAYFAVADGWFAGWAIIIFIAVLAIVQLAVQLYFFLHLGDESKPRLNLTVFAFMLIVVVIIVTGTLWIMNNLDYHDKSPQDTEQYLLEEEGIHGH